MVFPIAQEFPVPVDKIISAWPNRHTPYEIDKVFREMKEAGEEDIFYREYMLEIASRTMRVFKDEWIKYYKYNEMKKFFPKWNFYTSMDLAVSTKEAGDETAIITIGVSPEGHWYVVRADADQYTPHQAIDILFQHVSQYNPLEFRAEKAALQQVLDNFIDEEMEKRRIWFRREQLVYNTNVSKEYRIISLQPKMRMGKIHFPIDRSHISVEKIIRQIKGYIKTGHTTKTIDALDCLANFNDEGFVLVPNEEREQGTEIGDKTVVYEQNNNDPYIF